MGVFQHMAGFVCVRLNLLQKKFNLFWSAMKELPVEDVIWSKIMYLCHYMMGHIQT